MPQKRERLKSHVGMYYKNDFAELFTFQLVSREGKAVAFVDFNDGVAVRVAFVEELAGKQSALVRIGKRHLLKCRQNESQFADKNHLVSLLLNSP